MSKYYTCVYIHSINLPIYIPIYIYHNTSVQIKRNINTGAPLQEDLKAPRNSASQYLPYEEKLARGGSLQHV